MQVNGQLHDPAALPPGETAPSTQFIVGWVGPRSGLYITKKRKISYTYHESSPDPSVVQPVARRYTDWTNQAHSISECWEKYFAWGRESKRRTVKIA
jgi:hypothetical protein